MPRPRFSEMLLARRSELGLTLEQASRVLKLKEEVLAAFEEGDFEHMPQSGYAQGMLSSYARYLGLNAREVVDLYQQEFYQAQTGVSSHELRRRTRDTQSGRLIQGYDVLNEEGSRPKAYLEYRPLLPTSGGPAGDMGDFATTSPARSRSATPLSSRGGQGMYVPEGSSSVAQRRTMPDIHQSYSHEKYVSGRAYNDPEQTSQRGQSSYARRRGQAQRRRNDQTSRLISEGQRGPAERAHDARTQARSQRLYNQGGVSTRSAEGQGYTDDLRLGRTTRPYERASTVSGRRGSRNIANVERPNVRRRSEGSSRGASGPRRPPRRRRRGPVGAVQGFFSDPGRTLAAIIVVLAVALTLILVLSVSSCVGGGSSGETATRTVAVSSTTTQTTETTTQGSSDAQASTGSTEQGDTDAEGTDDASAAEGEASDDEEAVEQTVVSVSVAAGSRAWVEIVCDGTSEVAESKTGPWSAEYTVTDSISVSTDSPDAVTVTNNGEAVSFSSKAGGVGTVTIAGTPVSDATATDSTDSEETATE